MTETVDVTDVNGMKHDDKGLFSGYSGSAHHSVKHSDKATAQHQLEWIKPKPAFRLPAVKTNGPKKQAWRYADAQGKEYDTRVDRITNHPVSREMEDAINRLYRGEDIPMREIERLPEIAREEELANAYCTLDKYMHPEQYVGKSDKLNRIYNDFSADTITASTNAALKDGETYKVKKGKELWLVTGLPGSGKSTTFVGPISKANQARVVDCDAIKEQMPGFCHGLGSPNVHEQSKAINDRILAESLKRGDNIVYPVLGYNADYVGAQIEAMRRRGYKVHLILNELPYAQSLARCLERRLATGRNIPLAMFRKVGDRPSEAYETLKKQVDTYEKHTGDGIGTKLVESGENKDLPPVRRIVRPDAVQSVTSHNGLHSHNHDKYGNVQIPATGDWYGGDHHQYAKPSWIDLFKKKWHGAQDAGVELQTDDFGNPRIDDVAGLDCMDCAVTDDTEFDILLIPDSYDGEIEGYETAKDELRFATMDME